MPTRPRERPGRPNAVLRASTDTIAKHRRHAGTANKGWHADRYDKSGVSARVFTQPTERATDPVEQRVSPVSLLNRT